MFNVNNLFAFSRRLPQFNSSPYSQAGKLGNNISFNFIRIWLFMWSLYSVEKC